jgi:hypothetical protein
LDRIVENLPAAEKVKEEEARPELLGAVQAYGQSRYEFGAALSRYKSVFKKERTWLKISRLIGEHIGRSERTVFRIVADYERVSDAPKAVIMALQDSGLDPAAAKNAPLLEQVTITMPHDPTENEALAAVEQSLAFLKKGKYGFLCEDDRVVLSLRKDIRKHLNNIPDDRKRPLLERAIAEEAH